MANDTVDLSGGSSAGGLSGLTRKARDMAYARNPMNNNEVNLDSMERKAGVVPQVDLGGVQQQKSGTGQAARRTRTADAGGDQSTQIQSLQGSLGTLGLSLQAAVNDFVNSEAASAANVSLAESGSPVLDAQGNWVMPTSGEQVTAGLDGILANKRESQEALKAKAADLFDASGNNKRFEDVLAKFADTNGDGKIDANEQAFLNQSFGVVNAIRRINELNPNSPEAESLRLQLATQDKDGLVSGLMSAMERYDRITGMKIEGSEAESYQLRDLLSLGEDEIKSQLEKAITGSSGLFGADFEASLKRGVDESARQYSASSKEDVAVMNELTDQAQDWLKDYEDSFDEQRGKLNSMFNDSAQGVVADLVAVKASEAAAGRDTKWVDEAQRWFVDLQNGVKAGTQDFATVVQKLLSSEGGMSPEARDMLKKWVGQTVGEDTMEKGVLADTISKIAQTGMLYTTDEAGNTTKKILTSSQKMQVAQTMADDSLSTAEKSQTIQNLINAWSGKMGEDLKADSEHISGLIKDGQLTQALTSFREAMVGSLKDFRNSVSREFYNQVMAAGADPATLGPDAMQGLVKSRVDEKKKSVESAYNLAKNQVQTMIDTATRDEKETADYVRQLYQLRQDGYRNTAANVERAISDSANRYKSTIESVLKTYPNQPIGDLEAKSRAYGFIQLLRSARTANNSLYKAVKAQHPNIDSYLDKPKVALGLSDADNQAITTLNEWSKSVDSTPIWTTSEAANAILSQYDKLQAAHERAIQAMKSGEKLKLNLGSTYMNVTSEINSVMKMDPMKLFKAAKEGNTVDFADSTGVNNYTSKLAEFGGQAKFVEDATTGVSGQTTGQGTFGEVGTEGMRTLGGAGYVAPKVISPAGNNKNPKGGYSDEPASTPTQFGSTYTWHANDGTTGRINVPAGQTPESVMASRYPGLDTGTTGFERVAPITILGESIAKGAKSVKESFSNAFSGEGGGKSTPTREVKQPVTRSTSKDGGMDR